MWIEMFFIKFEGKIENILGNALNSMKNISIHIFMLLKTKQTVGIFFGRVTYSGNSYLKS